MSGVSLIAALAISLLGAEPLWPDISKMPAATGGGENDVAVVVAVERYAFLPHVRGAGELGVAWYNFLREVLKVPMPVLIQDNDATADGIREVVKAARAHQKPGGRFWFIFVGHGAPSEDGTDGMIVGVTAQANQREFFKNSVSRSEVLQLVAGRDGDPAPVVVIDACFSGTDVQGKTLVTDAQFAMNVQVLDTNEATVLTAGRAGDIAGSLPGGSGPAFSYLMLGALRGWGDSNGDGKVTAEEAVRYAQAVLLQLDPVRQQQPQHSGVDQALVGATGRKLEAGPDIGAIRLKLSGGGGGAKGVDEMDAKLEELMRAQREREEAQRREEELKNSARAEHNREVEERWTKVKQLADMGGPEGSQAVELFLQRYQGHPLGNPKEREAKELLARLTSEASGDELSRQLAALERARKEREEAERREAEALAKAKREREEAAAREAAAKRAAEEAARKKREEADRKAAAELAAAMKLHYAEVDKAWTQVKAVAQGGGPEGQKAIEIFLKRYEGHALGNPRKQEAQEMLERFGGAVSAASKGYILVKPGCFQMGSPSGEEGRDSDETQHEVCITKGYYLKETEVTQREWRELMGKNPSYFGSCGDTCPVERISWWDVVAYANALSKKEGLEQCYTLSGCSGTVGGGCKSGEVWCVGDYKCSSVSFKGLGCKGYRLPTEAEWEYAARAGSREARHGNLDDVAWYDKNSGSKTKPVRQKKPNAWGFYDMLGNVWEWTWDWYGSYDSTRNDPMGHSTGSGRVDRGGGWIGNARGVRSANRDGDDPGDRGRDLGFRLCRSQ